MYRLVEEVDVLEEYDPPPPFTGFDACETREMTRGYGIN